MARRTKSAWHKHNRQKVLSSFSFIFLCFFVFLFLANKTSLSSTMTFCLQERTKYHKHWTSWICSGLAFSFSSIRSDWPQTHTNAQFRSFNILLLVWFVQCFASDYLYLFLTVCTVGLFSMQAYCVVRIRKTNHTSQCVHIVPFFAASHRNERYEKHSENFNAVRLSAANCPDLAHNTQKVVTLCCLHCRGYFYL